ncbi:MAG TPA: nickel-binding protein [Gaiellaceae bacterium]|nr:nickel-binding protein [Gaiellaceae bacterium]
MPRYLVIRRFDVNEDQMPEVGSRSRRVIEESYPKIIWEHSHVVVDKDGTVLTYCVYDAPNEEMVRDHSGDLGQHTIDDILEIAGDVTPQDFPV